MLISPGRTRSLISAMGVQKSSAHQLIARCKAGECQSDRGGAALPAEPYEFPEVDHLVLKEAEITLPQFPADSQRTAPAHSTHA